MHKRSLILTGGLSLAAALAGLNSTPPLSTTTNVGARVRQMTGTILPGGEAKAAKQTPAQPAARPASKLELAIEPLPFGLKQVRMHARSDRRRVKYGRHRWVVLS